MTDELDNGGESGGADTSLRDAISSAFEGAETDSEPAPAKDAPAAPAEGKGTEGERDDKGRFQEKAKDAKAPALKPVVVPTARPGDKPAVTPALAEAPVTKAPQSWKPAARAEWAKVPPAIQAEVQRREQQIAKALQDSSAASRDAQSFRQVLAPFEPNIRAMGGDPLRTVDNLLRTQHVLQVGTQAQRDDVLVSLLNQFGGDLAGINARLGGTPQQGGQPQPQQVDPNALAQQIERSILQRMQGQRQQAQLAQAQGEVESFSEKFEFLDDVREEMADILDMAARRGREITPDDAYARACALHPEISGVMEQRKAAQSANATLASTQKARAAASSVRGQPTGGMTAPQGDSLRDTIEASIAQLSGR